MKVRIIEKGGKFYPQHYSLGWFRWTTGWFTFTYDEPCAITNSPSEEDWEFDNRDAAKAFLKGIGTKLRPAVVVWEGEIE